MANLTLELADILQNFGVKSAYGTPVEINGTTIVPVALTSYGFGGGEGDTPDGDKQGSGSGGGGGGMSIPLGAYVPHEGATRVEPNTISSLYIWMPMTFYTESALDSVVNAIKR